MLKYLYAIAWIFKLQPPKLWRGYATYDFFSFCSCSLRIYDITFIYSDIILKSRQLSKSKLRRARLKSIMVYLCTSGKSVAFKLRSQFWPNSFLNMIATLFPQVQNYIFVHKALIFVTLRCMCDTHQMHNVSPRWQVT